MRSLIRNMRILSENDQELNPTGGKADLEESFVNT